MTCSPGADSLLKFLNDYDNFAIIGHEEPDGDCLGSQLAIAHFLERRGKSAMCYSPGPFIRPEVMRYSSEFSTGPIDGAEAVVIVFANDIIFWTF